MIPETYSTTLANDDDIEKIFETYENQYIKNSNWFNNDSPTRNLKEAEVDSSIQKPVDVESEGNSTPSDSETTDTTVDDVVDTIHNIIDEKIEKKKNRTDRTIVVVVTTNVFNVNGSDDTGKRQHTLLSFGTPGMIPKETSTDATLALHNKITTEFFNRSPIIKESGIIKTDGEKFNHSISKTNEYHGDNNSNSVDILPTTEDERVIHISTTEKPNKQDESHDEYNNVYDNFNNIDIRRLHDSIEIQNSAFKPVDAESRNFDPTIPNDNSNDILRIMKIVPSRSEEEINLSSLSKPFDVPVQEPKDTSLMEAIENILDKDVRKAFERDIPHTRHVPLDINIEEEALYAPLKDLSEYIVEEIPINIDIVNNYKADDIYGAGNKLDEADRFEVEKYLAKSLENNIETEHISLKPNERDDSLISKDELPSTTTTNVVPTTTFTTEDATTEDAATEHASTEHASTEHATTEDIADRRQFDEIAFEVEGEGKLFSFIVKQNFHTHALLFEHIRWVRS